MSFGQRDLENADDASGENENTLGYVEAKGASKLKASEGCKGRHKFGSDLHRASQRI